MSGTKYCQKEVVHPFCLPTSRHLQTMFFNEIYVTLNKILGKYDNILPAGDLNIDELKPSSDLSNHLPDANDVFNLENLVKKPTCFKS